MRSFAAFALALAAVSAYLAWTMLGLDLTSYNADQQTALRLTFTCLAGIAIAGPILAVVALSDDANARRRYPHRYERSARSYESRRRYSRR